MTHRNTKFKVLGFFFSVKEMVKTVLAHKGGDE